MQHPASAVNAVWSNSSVDIYKEMEHIFLAVTDVKSLKIIYLCIILWQSS